MGVQADSKVSDRSLWNVLNPNRGAWEKVTAPDDLDIVIVGAGVSGLSLAFHLADAGIRPLVIEARNVGGGAAEKSAGIVAPQLVRHTPGQLGKHFGGVAGDRFRRLVADAGHYTFSLARSDWSAIGASQNGFLAPARGPEGQERVRRIAAEWSACRNDVEAIDGAELERLSGCTGYAGAIHDKSGGSLNPLGYLDHLARQAAALGATIRTASPVQKLTRRGDRWVLHVNGTTISARRVFLCANGGNPELHPGLSRTCLPLSVCQIATRPLDAALRKAILPSNHALTDMESDVFSIRFDPEGRLITAYPGVTHATDLRALTKAVNRRLSAALPAYEATELEHAWIGTAWLNSDLLPRLSQVDDNLFAIQACNGRGIALNTVIGRDVAKWVSGGMTGEPPLPLQQPRPVPGYLAARHIPGILMKYSALKLRFRGEAPHARM